MVHPQPSKGLGPGASLPPGAPPPSPPSRAGNVALTVLGVVLLVVCGVAVTGFVLLTVGPTAFLVGLAAATLPVVVLVAVYQWLDRYEPEPVGWVVFAVGWGAAVATTGTLVLSLPPTLVIEAVGLDTRTVSAVVVAPIVEEALKGLGIAAIVLLARRPLDGVTDGFVYAGFVGLGFAFTENILYLGSALLEAGSTGLVATFILRGIVSPFAHPLFTAATGIAIALAGQHRGGRRTAIVAGGLAVAIVLHAVWNLAAVGSLQGFLMGFVFLQIPIFTTFVVAALLVRAREGRVIARNLEVYARYGWFTELEVAMLGSLTERRRAVERAAVVGGSGDRKAMKRFQRVAARLAYLRNRIDRGTAPWDAQHREAELLEQLTAVRRRFARAAARPWQPEAPGFEAQGGQGR